MVFIFILDCQKDAFVCNQLPLIFTAESMIFCIALTSPLSRLSLHITSTSRPSLPNSGVYLYQWMHIEYVFPWLKTIKNNQKLLKCTFFIMGQRSWWGRKIFLLRFCFRISWLLITFEVIHDYAKYS